MRPSRLVQEGDGTVVLYLAMIEQLEAVTVGSTVHVVGKASEFMRDLKRRRAVVVRYAT
jgi:hypothetical protein